MPFILAVTMRLYIAAARCPPRSDPQNSQDFGIENLIELIKMYKKDPSLLKR